MCKSHILKKFKNIWEISDLEFYKTYKYLKINEANGKNYTMKK